MGKVILDSNNLFILILGDTNHLEDLKSLSQALLSHQPSTFATSITCLENYPTQALEMIIVSTS